MGNCLLLLGLKKEKRPVTLLLVGLDNAGKTTAAKGIVGEPVDDVAPTVGFAPETLEYRGCEVTIYDLGGGAKIRPVWTKYFSEVHGVIFVVDSSNASRVEECKEVLMSLLADKKIAGKPVLILANKQDLDGALDEIDLVESLNVEQIVNRYKCPTRVETCSALTTRNHKPDKPIADGFRWLIDTIVVHYKELNKRVTKDLEYERKQLQIEMQKRKERISRLRAQREALEGGMAGQEESTSSLPPPNPSPPPPTSSPSPAESSVAVTSVQVIRHELPSTSCVPNGSLPQSRQGAADRVMSPEDRQELRELGFDSSNELHNASSSLSSSSPSPPPSPSPPTQEDFPSTAATAPQREPDTPRQTTQTPPPGPPLPHKVILVRESSPPQIETSQVTPEAQVTAAPQVVSPQVTAGPLHVSPIQVTPATSITSPASGAGKLDLSLDRREGECIPIDSDDELFDMGAPSPRYHLNAHNHNHTTTPSSSSVSIGSGGKGENRLDLEISVKPNKKKSFLRRYHKTAPLLPPQA